MKTASEMTYTVSGVSWGVKLYSVQSNHTSEIFRTYTNRRAVFSQPVRIFYVLLPALIISVDVPAPQIRWFSSDIARSINLFAYLLTSVFLLFIPPGTNYPLLSKTLDTFKHRLKTHLTIRCVFLVNV